MKCHELYQNQIQSQKIKFQLYFNAKSQMPTQYCQFCHILSTYNQSKSDTSVQQILIDQNQQFFAFEDYNKAAKQHILICTKEHIETALDIDPPEKLQRMKLFGQKTLNKIIRQQALNSPLQTRYCFRYKEGIVFICLHTSAYITCICIAWSFPSLVRTTKGESSDILVKLYNKFY